LNKQLAKTIWHLLFWLQLAVQSLSNRLDGCFPEKLLFFGSHVI